MAIILLAFYVFRIGGHRVVAESARRNIPTLVFGYWWEEKVDILENLKNQFEELNPDIKISLDFRPYEELRQGKLSGEKGAWDIIALDPLWIPELLAHERIEAEVFPILRYFHPLLYNIDILRNAGFSRPPRTRTEFLAQARTVTLLGLYGIAFALGSDNSRGINRDIYSWLWAGGILLEDLEIPVQDNRISAETRALIDTLDFLALLQEENILLPDTFILGEAEKRKAFLEGQIAFMIGSAEDMEIFRQEMGEVTFDYTAIPVPDTYTGRPLFGSGGWSLGIAKESEYKDEALTFISFLLEQSPLLAEGWAIPENGSHSYPQDLFYSKAWELYITGDLIQESPGAGQDAIFREELINFFERRIMATEAAQIIQRRLQEL